MIVYGKICEGICNNLFLRRRLLCSENMDIPDPKVLEEAEELYFEVFNVQPMRLNLSFMRTERINAPPVEDRLVVFLYLNPKYIDGV